MDHPLEDQTRQSSSTAMLPMLVHFRLCFDRVQVLERALSQASSQFNTDPSNPTVGFVRLSGALHCDERSAFQEIAHQLCRCAAWQSNSSAVVTLALTSATPAAGNYLL